MKDVDFSHNPLKKLKKTSHPEARLIEAPSFEKRKSPRRAYPRKEKPMSA
jgi:hypothetical protein